MPAKKQYKVDIDVVPYLSIMAIVLKLICLILIVMVMRIAVNPDALKIIRYSQLYQPPEEAGTKASTGGGTERQISREPIYIDCHADHVEVQPEGTIISIMDLQQRGGALENVLKDLVDRSSNSFAIVIARPNSAPVYRYVRRQITARKLTVGYDVLESHVIIEWDKELERVQARKEEIAKARAAHAAAFGTGDAAGATKQEPTAPAPTPDAHK